MHYGADRTTQSGGLLTMLCALGTLTILLLLHATVDGFLPLLVRQRVLSCHYDAFSQQPTGATRSDDDESTAEEEEEPSVLSKLDKTKKRTKKKFVVVGAGWAGWGAAKALCESSSRSSNSNFVESQVIIVDAIPDPTGRTPFLSETETGKPVEAGTRGFWKDYPNINALCAYLGLKESDVFTDYTNSSFYSPDGLEATSPVFAQAKIPDFSNGLLPPGLIPDVSLADFPSPLGQVLASLPLFERIPVADRSSVLGFLLATVDCVGNDDDEVVQRQYDRMTGHDLFLQFGLSPRLVKDIIEPLVLVCLFKPPEELSALVVLELFYFFTLAHMDSFDVRWIKNGTVADSLTGPLATRLEEERNLQVLGGCRVGKITLVDADDTAAISSGMIAKKKKVSTVEYTSKDGTKSTIQDVDGVVLALTCRGMRAVVSASPDLARYPVFAKASSCEGIDVMSVRLWLDRRVPTRTPSNIFSRFKELRGSGGTFFMLDQLQDSDAALRRLWGKDGKRADETKQLGSVVACDFYNAGALLPLTNQDIVDTLMKDLLPAAVPEFENAQVIDSWVGRYPGAVSWFAPGTFDKRPPLQGAGQDALPNLKCAGDWVRMGEKEHGAKGLCQERAYVSGLEAANALLEDTIDENMEYTPHMVIPVREDEIQFQASVAINKEVMKFLPRFWVR